MLICRNHVDVGEGVRRCARCQVPFCRDCLVDIAGRPYCATCKTEQLMDYRSGVDRSTLELASLWNRFGAVFIDGLITAIPMYIIMFALMFGTMSTKGEPNPLVQFIGVPFMFLQMIYEGAMLAAKNGQTLGKMALHVRVVRPDGSSITSGQAWGRAALRMVLGCLWIVDYIPAFFTQEKTTLHDMIAGTRVVSA